VAQRVRCRQGRVDPGGGAPSTIRQLASCLAIRPLDRFGINPLLQDFLG
jgi:hypothetical protein